MGRTGGRRGKCDRRTLKVHACHLLKAKSDLKASLELMELAQAHSSSAK